MKKIIQIIIIFFSLQLFAAKCYAQPTKEELTRQRQALVKEIEELNASLSQVKGKKQGILKELEKRKRKVDAYEELVNNINKKIKSLDDDLYLKQVEIYRLSKELDTLKAKYRKSVVYAYKNRSNYQYLNFLFSSKSFDDALKRIAYLKSYRKTREEEAGKIVNMQQFVKQNIDQLNNTKTDKQQTLEAKTLQLASFEEAKKEQEEAAKQIRGQEKELFVQLSKKEKERRDLSNAITAVIKKERDEAAKKEKERLAKLKLEAELKKKQLEAEALIKKQALAKAKADAEAKAKADAAVKAAADEKAKRAEEEAALAEKKLQQQKDDDSKIGKVIKSSTGKDRVYNEFEATPEGLKLSENFENNRRKLPWPVERGTICGEFGVSMVGKLKVQRDGIEICTQVGLPVRVVANGEVSSITDLGDYSYIMVKHGRYRTIYNKVAGISVTKGQILKAGDIIGKVSVGDDGEGDFEFLVMNDFRFENPKNWLRPR